MLFSARAGAISDSQGTPNIADTALGFWICVTKKTRSPISECSCYLAQKELALEGFEPPLPIVQDTNLPPPTIPHSPAFAPAAGSMKSLPIPRPLPLRPEPDSQDYLRRSARSRAQDYPHRRRRAQQACPRRSSRSFASAVGATWHCFHHWNRSPRQSPRRSRFVGSPGCRGCLGCYSKAPTRRMFSRPNTMLPGWCRK